MLIQPTIDALLATRPDRDTCIALDIDNTVADTRYRTMAVARAFDATHNASYFSNLTLDQVTLDGQSTARSLGLSSEIAIAFQAFWISDSGFWCGDHFCSDRPMEPVARIAKQARANGFKIVWLTGRIEALRSPTEDWLANHGLAIGTLVCKPNLGVRTAQFKAEFLRALSQRQTIAFFMTESSGDIAAVQAMLPDLCCVLVDFPHREPASLQGGTMLLRLE